MLCPCPRAMTNAFFVVPILSCAAVVATETPLHSCEYDVCSHSSSSSAYFRALCDFASSAVPFKANRTCNAVDPLGQLAMPAIAVVTDARSNVGGKWWKQNESADHLELSGETEPIVTHKSLDSTNITWLRANIPQILVLYFHRQQVWNNHVWYLVSGVHRHNFHKHPEHLKGPVVFFASVEFFEWGLFLIALGLCICLCRAISNLSSGTQQRMSFHVIVLILWFLIGTGYNRMVWWRLGRDEGLCWTSGYLLEIIFSIENVFVFSSILAAFKVPQRSAHKAILVVIACQIVFQMCLIMGLASWLRSLEFLPYVLGAWIIYVGWCVCEQHQDIQGDIAQSLPIKFMKFLFGDRFVSTYDEAGSIFIKESARGQVQLTMLAAAILTLVIADFCLEVDVTLSKVEAIPKQYISFTSSAIAAFMIPDLLFVINVLATRYTQLRFGISFALIFFGAEMMLHHFFTLPDIVGCSIMIGAMVMSILYAEIESFIFSDGKPSHSGAPRLPDSRLSGVASGSSETPS